MKDSISLQIRVLDHPLDRKSLTPFSGAGVYVFLAAERKLIEDKLSHSALLLQVLRDELEVCYIGKAKHLNKRLQTYRGAGSASPGIGTKRINWLKWLGVFCWCQRPHILKRAFLSFC